MRSLIIGLMIIGLMIIGSWSTKAEPIINSKLVLESAIHHIKMHTGATIEEGPYIVQVLKSRSACQDKGSVRDYTRYACNFSIKVTVTVDRPFYSYVKSCAINFFIKNNDLQSLSSNESQMISCLEALGRED